MSQDANSYKELGNQFLRQKLYTKAIDAYTQSLAIEPSAPVFCNRSVAYRNINQLSEALADTDNALNVDPTFVKAHLRRAQVYEVRNLSQKALNEYKILYSLDPTPENAKLVCKATEKLPDLVSQADNYKQAGNNSYSRKNYQQAVEEFTKSLELYPSPPVFSNRAAAYYELNQPEQAYEDATMALSMDPRYAKAYRRRAAACEKMGRWEEAGYDYHELSILEPQNKRNYLAMQQNCNQKQKKKDKVDPYATLGLEDYRGKDIPENVLNKAYRKVAAKWHTDRFVGKPQEEVDKAADMYRKCGEAKDILSDRRRKMAFDQGIDDDQFAGMGGMNMGGFNMGGMPTTFSFGGSGGQGFSFGGIDPSILFQQMGFGGPGGGSFSFGGDGFSF